MTTSFGDTASRLIATLLECPGSTLSETATTCRIDRTACSDGALLDRVRETARVADTEGFGRLRLFGDISGEHDPIGCVLEDVDGEALSLVIEKESEEGWRYFLTESGFAYSLPELASSVPVTAWVSARFEPFSAIALLVTPWDGTRSAPRIDVPLERPRKLVRDLTSIRTPTDVSPWLLSSAPSASSPAYVAWRKAAAERLIFALPSEIRKVDGADVVALKGLRSAPIPVSAPLPALPEQETDALMEAAAWVYGVQRETEARFQFLNYQLSVYWPEGSAWPEGLVEALPASLVGAKEAYGFHLEDQSKEALKSLGDLRKGLQEEVARAQSSTRDLISSLWRDLGIAGVVLALKSPMAPQIAGAEALRWVTLATSVLLMASLCVTGVANARFNSLADRSRVDWRKRLYAFVSPDEWKRLVEAPIKSGRWVYRLALTVVAVLYLVAAAYLFAVSEPDLAARVWTFLKHMVGATAGA